MGEHTTQELRRQQEALVRRVSAKRNEFNGIMKGYRKVIRYGYTLLDADATRKHIEQQLEEVVQEHNEALRELLAVDDELKDSLREDAMTDEQKARRAERMARRAADREHRLNANRLA